MCFCWHEQSAALQRLRQVQLSVWSGFKSRLWSVLKGDRCPLNVFCDGVSHFTVIFYMKNINTLTDSPCLYSGTVLLFIWSCTCFASSIKNYCFHFFIGLSNASWELTATARHVWFMFLSKLLGFILKYRIYVSLFLFFFNTDKKFFDHNITDFLIILFYYSI